MDTCYHPTSRLADLYPLGVGGASLPARFPVANAAERLFLSLLAIPTTLEKCLCNSFPHPYDVFMFSERKKLKVI